MGCIEIWSERQIAVYSRINRNMGCIEIANGDIFTFVMLRLIETWDVLKYLLWCDICANYVINRNMGCIEILPDLVFLSPRQ